MKIYIAAPWIHREDMPNVAKKLEDKGHTITKKWWEVKEAKEGSGKDYELRTQAEDDVRGVRNADLVLVINSAKSEGKALEQGVAIALDKPIVIVGKRGEHSKNVFHYLPIYKWVDDLEGALNVIDTINWLLENDS